MWHWLANYLNRAIIPSAAELIHSFVFPQLSGVQDQVFTSKPPR